MNKTEFVEKRYRDKLKKDKKEIRINITKRKNWNRKVQKFKQDYNIFNHQIKNQKRQQINKGISNMN